MNISRIENPFDQIGADDLHLDVGEEYDPVSVIERPSGSSIPA